MKSLYKLDSISPIEIARQLTLIESELFFSIKCNELLDKAWMSDEKERLSPNVIRFTTHFNLVSSWVALSIIRSDPKQRAKTYRKFVKIAAELYKLNNLSGVFEVMGGLCSSSVHRLKKTHESLSSNHNQV